MGPGTISFWESGEGGNIIMGGGEEKEGWKIMGKKQRHKKGQVSEFRELKGKGGFFSP